MEIWRKGEKAEKYLKDSKYCSKEKIKNILAGKVSSHMKIS